MPLIAINPCSESNRLLPRKCRLFAPGKDAVENFFCKYRAIRHLLDIVIYSP